MKIQIDTQSKTLRIEQEINLGEFIDSLGKLLPDWREYKLETVTRINNWTTPIVIDRYPTYPYPYWWTSPIYPSTVTIGDLNTGTGTVTCQSTLTSTSGTYGTNNNTSYCLEVNTN